MYTYKIKTMISQLLEQLLANNKIVSESRSFLKNSQYRNWKNTRKQQRRKKEWRNKLGSWKKNGFWFTICKRKRRKSSKNKQFENGDKEIAKFPKESENKNKK